MKALVRSLLRRTLPLTGLRGRHFLADRLGRWAMPDPAVELLPVNGIRIEIDHRLSTCRHMYYGIYEESFVRFLQRTLKPGDVVFDLGANIGYIMAVAHGLVGPEGLVAAFEPSRICHGQISRNNPQLPRGVQLFNAAIMDRSGSFPFMDTPRVISSGFSVLFHNREAGPDDQVYDVEAISIDDAAQRLGLERIACIKMDIEGAELIALKGAQRVLSTGAVDHVLVETTNMSDAGHAENERIIAVLQGHGYAPHLPDRLGRLHPWTIDLGQRFRTDIIWKRIAEA
jgi:FkbM family methyltransferase